MIAPNLFVKILPASPVRLLNSAKFLSALADKSISNLTNDYRIDIAKANDARCTLNFLEENFFQHEPLSKSLNITRKSIEGSMEIFIKNSLKDGFTMIARDNSPNNEIIGVSLNIRSCKFNAKKYKELASCAPKINTKKLFHVWALLSSEPHLQEVLNQPCLFEIKMLAVKRCHQDKGVASELVKNSLTLAKDLNFSHASINCTSEYAKRIANRQNMKNVWEVDYKNIVLSDAKTPLATPELPHVSASVWLANLKEADNK